MGEDFHDGLRNFGKRYNMQNVIEQVLNLMPLGNQANTSIISEEANRLRDKRFKRKREGASSPRIREVYTSRTRRRAIEYLSIDDAY
jgi:hypothetical protein